MRAGHELIWDQCHIFQSGASTGTCTVDGRLDVMRVRTGDGRQGTAVYEITGARHHHFFPDAVVDGALPT
jgi:hypothetical protein